MAEPLTGSSTLSRWLDDAVGGPAVRHLLQQLGQQESDLGPALGIPLRALVEMSGGRITRNVVDDLVRTVHHGRLVEDNDRPAAPERAFRTDRTLADIQIRDPFVARDDDSGQYWLYGSTDPNIWFGPGIGFDAYRSADLHTWTGPYPAFRPPADFWSPGQYWAPEVHRHDGRWYMFATFTGSDGHRGTQILVADEPSGPFEAWSDGAVTPDDWQCLDGTYFLDDAHQPWIVYCREWTQVGDGEIVAQRLAADLARTVGSPHVLFSATAAPWVEPVPGVRTEAGEPAFVTDGPHLRRIDGRLVMLWSSFGAHGYAIGVAHAIDGTLTGPWRQEEEPLWAADGGHGMILDLPDQSPALILHRPNTTPLERATILPVVIDRGTVRMARTPGADAEAPGR